MGKNCNGLPPILSERLRSHPEEINRGSLRLLVDSQRLVPLLNTILLKKMSQRDGVYTGQQRFRV